MIVFCIKIINMTLKKNRFLYTYAMRYNIRCLDNRTLKKNKKIF